MFDIASLFISTAMAQDAAATVAPATANMDQSTLQTLMRFLPLFLVFGVFYFLLIRPQQKQLAKQGQMIKALKKGDKVILSGGLIGTVSKADHEDYLMVEIAKDVQVKVVRATIQALVDEKYDDDAKGSASN
ncbi:MAG: preprotein translocase subunit YajC [Proteobacteria bacterium]|jgi:preprotein translocase subunit YajC|nr:preprotein translocase subunit YajC [Alphaproteobacteria bacterium]NCC03797.1 preprotein translocase subunit YajC [Pseudomonadota bacterium]